MRVWLDGQNGQVNVPANEQIRFTDPNSGYTYVARLHGDETIDGKTVDKGIASRMLKHANDLLAASYEHHLFATSGVPAGCQVGASDARIGKPCTDAQGKVQLKLDANGQPVVSETGAGYVSEITKYVGVLDSLREIEYRLGYGPFWGSADD
jgi:hypothetical protein